MEGILRFCTPSAPSLTFVDHVPGFCPRKDCASSARSVPISTPLYSLNLSVLSLMACPLWINPFSSPNVLNLRTFPGSGLRVSSNPRNSLSRGDLFWAVDSSVITPHLLSVPRCRIFRNPIQRRRSSLEKPPNIPRGKYMPIDALVFEARFDTPAEQNCTMSAGADRHHGPADPSRHRPRRGRYRGNVHGDGLRPI